MKNGLCPGRDFQHLLTKEKELKRSGLHSFHRYFGKLIPAIPAFAIKNLTLAGEWVCDPFAGSGTTLVEARLNGRNAFGIEINPISCFISKVKTTPLDTGLLQEINGLLLADIAADTSPAAENERPFCPNCDHWFKSFVQEDLARINRCINLLFERHHVSGMTDKTGKEIMDFYRLVLSSVIRNVSNADIRHIFPGYSKRLRRLDSEEKRDINVYRAFNKALLKKTVIMDELTEDTNCKVVMENADTVNINPESYPKAALIVTNPPYISSVRYIETMKLELYWMEFLFCREEYRDLEKKMLGNDRLTKEEFREPVFTGHDDIDSIVREIYRLCPKSGVVVARYFNDMEKVIININRLLHKGGHVVMKISDSRVKKIKIETGLFLSRVALMHGFKLVDMFVDKIENRSLLTARNTYSDIITHDYIVIWRKEGSGHVQ